MQFINRQAAHEFYRSIIQEAKKVGQVREVMARLGLSDLFFLLVYLCNRKDVDRDWLFDRCQEVQNKSNGYLDLWAREHYKSTVITFGLTIQDVLFDPEVTIGIFSITRPNAKKFLNQIKREFEINAALKELYPDVLWDDPQKQAPKWSLDDGIILKRELNPKESTVEAYGLVEGLPTGPHFNIRMYDDIIDEKNVTNPDMIKKSQQAWELSLSLGSTRPCKRYSEVDIARYAGTRYHYNDPYAEIIRRGSAIPRIYPGTKNGEVDGEPVLWSRELMEKKRRDMGPYIFGCQILQNPKADEAQGFKDEWLEFWSKESTIGLNLYLLCDPASEKKKTNDFTVILVIGLAQDQNYYLVDGIRDRLNLKERTEKMIEFHRKYRPLKVGYEKYGKDSDIEHIKDVQDRTNYRFNIIELGGSMPKNDRIRKLIPLFSDHRFYLPRTLPFITYERKEVDLVRVFLDEEYKPFPVGAHDDILDCMARITDESIKTSFPSKPVYQPVHIGYQPLDNVVGY